MYEVTTDTKFFESKHLDIESKGIPALCLLTMAVDNETPRVDNVKTKKNKRKFSTYQRHIIYKN